jgi:hypothetical protein
VQRTPHPPFGKPNGTFSHKGRRLTVAAVRRRRGELSAMPARKKTEIDPENPEWTEADFARAKAARDALPKEVLSAFKRTGSAKRSTRRKKR